MAESGCLGWIFEIFSWIIIDVLVAFYDWLAGPLRRRKARRNGEPRP